MNKISTYTSLSLAEVEQAKKLGLTNVPDGTLRKIANKEEENVGLSVNYSLFMRCVSCLFSNDCQFK